MYPLTIDCFASISNSGVEEMMQERGITVDHSTIHRSEIHNAPQLEIINRTRKLRLPAEKSLVAHANN
jgi:transposase-like protein